MIFRGFFLLLLLAAATAAQAQQYRWVDGKGRVQFGDVPPPDAKDVRKSDVAAAKPEPAPLPFELAELQRNFPVTLYTAPACKAPCELARGALNKRGVPFNEIQVWNAETREQLKQAAGTPDNVPVLTVGRSVLSGFDQGAFDTLLDSTGYPAVGRFPARSQSAPAAPESLEPSQVAEPIPPAPSPGPYDASGLTGPPPKPGQYDPSGLTGPAPKPGQYGVPAESK